MNFSGIPNASIVGKLLRAPLKLIPPSTVVPILQGPLRGKKWIVGSSTNGCWFGSLEYDKQQRFKAIVASGNVVYDLGANVGFYTLLASVLVGKSGHVYAFEPLARNIAYLRRHLAMNNIENCTVVEAAVAASEGYSRFDPSPAHTTAHLAETGQEIVRTLNLDPLVSRGEILPPDVVKIDIEGSELQALEGFQQTITKYRPTIFLATHGAELHKACLEFFIKCDYGLESLTSKSFELTDEVLASPTRAARQV
jgi:FkbM family methyltransferase